ncbi:fused MFS/spermidine synthase [Pseudoduganella rivuli]|nr:fused MFS/spermidine synthase [Pseudoduganella rivuli]
MHVDNPDELILGYTQSMMGALLLQPDPRHIGMIGLGGGSLLKFCHRHLPEAAISVAEIDPEVIALRDQFHIPDGSERLAVHCIDGAEFVRHADRLFDLLMVDGFDRGGQPAQLCSRAFYADCHRSLAPGGVMVVNLLGDNMEETQEYIARMRASFGAAVLAVDAVDSQNRIVFACKDGLPALDDTALWRRVDSLDMLHPVALGAVARALQFTLKMVAGSRGLPLQPGRFGLDEELAG